MTRKRLGAIDRETVSELRGAAEEAARDRRSGATLKAPPIAQVAGAAARSIEIIFIAASPQPKNGTRSNSFFSTNTRGGKISCSPTVSQAEWCWASTTDGSSGMFSRPRTR